MKNVSLFVSLCLGASATLVAGPGINTRDIDPLTRDTSPARTTSAAPTTPGTPQKPARKATGSSLSSATSATKDEATEEAGAAGEASMTNSFLHAEGSENDDEAAASDPSPQKKPLNRPMFLKVDEACGDGPTYPSPNPFSVGNMMALPDADTSSNNAFSVHGPSDEPRPTPVNRPDFGSSSDPTPASKRKTNDQSAGPASLSKRAKNEEGWESD